MDLAHKQQVILSTSASTSRLLALMECHRRKLINFNCCCSSLHILDIQAAIKTMITRLRAVLCYCNELLNAMIMVINKMPEELSW
jgi:hypothetical protein